jgi:hypothetical protein
LKRRKVAAILVLVLAAPVGGCGRSSGKPPHPPAVAESGGIAVSAPSDSAALTACLVWPKSGESIELRAEPSDSAPVVGHLPKADVDLLCAIEFGDQDEVKKYGKIVGPVDYLRAHGVPSGGWVNVYEDVETPQGDGGVTV